jgi:hypothetical protein
VAGKIQFKTSLSSHLSPKIVKYIKIYKIIILSVFLYEYETWSLTLWEEYRLKVLENRVLWRIFVPKKNVGVGGWRKLHNDELHKFYPSPNRMRMTKREEDEMSRARSMQWEEKESVQYLGGKARRKETTRKTETYS